MYPLPINPVDCSLDRRCRNLPPAYRSGARCTSGGVWLLQGSRARVLGFSILGGFTGVQHSQAGLLEGRRRSPEALHGETESEAHASPKLLNR